MDYSEHLNTIKPAFQTIKKCFDYFETYMDVTYVPNEDELMELVNGGKAVIYNLLADLESKIEACEDGHDILSYDELEELMNSLRSSSRILYYLNMSIFDDILVGYSMIEIYGMPEEDNIQDEEY